MKLVKRGKFMTGVTERAAPQMFFFTSHSSTVLSYEETT